MPNHYHLLLQPKIEGGISLFMKKLGVAYTKHVNKTYQRSGHAFQSGYQAKLINNDGYLLHISRYIHLNPLSLIEPDWEQRGVLNLSGSMVFLEEYPWSSYKSWLGKNHFLKIFDPALARMQSGINHAEFIQGWLKYRGPTSEVGPRYGL